jgi:glycerophosphoryl diester phosphodiesterase
VYIQSFEVENLLELQHRVMPAAGVAFPLVQLYGDLQSSRPYDMAYNVARGADLTAIYDGLVARMSGGIDAGTRYGALATGPVLEWMKAAYAAGIGPWKGSLLPRMPIDPQVEADHDGGAGLAAQGDTRAHPMLGWALKAGLVVHPYALRAEEFDLAQAHGVVPQSVIDEALRLYGLGVQGFFIDQPDLGVAARRIFLETNRAID